MKTALQIAQEVVARSKSVDGIPLTDYVRGGMSYCQQFAGNFWEQVMGRVTPNSYNSAKNAMLASGGLNGDYNAAPPGAYHYFDYSVYGHVGVALGSGLMASGTGWGTNAVAHLGKHVYIHRVADYARHLNYRGWAMTNGARATLVGLVSDANAPQVAPNQRQVKPNADARLRQKAPSLNSPYTAVKAGSIVTPDGFVRSTIAGGATADGNNIWFKFGENFCHSSVFTDSGTHDLVDLGTIAPPKPIQFFTVTVNYNNLTNDVKNFTVEEGKVFAEPTAPADDDFDFVGWTVNGEPYDFSKPVTGHLEIDAEWEAKPIPEEPEPGPGEEVDPPTQEPGDDNSEVPTKGIPWGVIIAGIVTAIFAAIAGAFGIGGA